MKLALPRLGNIDVINETIVTDMGHKLIETPPNSKKTMDLGVRYSPEYCCLPLKISLGNLIEVLDLGAEGLVMAGGTLPFRILRPGTAGYIVGFRLPFQDDCGGTSQGKRFEDIVGEY